MSVNISTEADPLWVFVRLTGPFVDAITRAPDLESFIEAAKAAELMYQREDGEWHVSPGVHIDHIGPIILTPAVRDEDGNQIEPPVLDERHHVNIRLAPPATERVDDYGVLKWHKWASAWTMGGQDDLNINAQEQAKVLMNVALIDPDTISTPTRVWA